MKRKFFAFLLAICLILPCVLMFSACGGSGHTHKWSTDYSKNSVSHWLTCDGCNEKKELQEHNILDGICTVCGYESIHQHSWPDTYLYNESEHWKECSYCHQETSRVEHNFDNDNACECGYVSTSDVPTVSSVGNLEVITYDSGESGLFTLVRLPDGKIMVIDATDERFDSYIHIEDELLYNEGLWAIDYLVLTNTSSLRTGQATYPIRNTNVINLYTPREIDGYNTSCYSAALETALEYGTNIKEVDDTTCDFTSTFKESGNSTIYSYTVDFMLPVETADCQNDIDASIVISIEYQGKTILITSDATNTTIDGYANKYNGEKDVDVLITSFVDSEPDAITNSAARGEDYLNSISLKSGDYAIISSTSSTENVSALDTLLSGVCGRENTITMLNSTDVSKVSVSINKIGEISITNE